MPAKHTGSKSPKADGASAAGQVRALSSQDWKILRKLLFLSFLCKAERRNNKDERGSEMQRPGE